MCTAHHLTCARCAYALGTRYARCGHASLHGLDPTRCPHRMKRRRWRDGRRLCGRCEGRKGSLSCWPGEEGEEDEEDEEEGSEEENSSEAG